MNYYAITAHGMLGPEPLDVRRLDVLVDAAMEELLALGAPDPSVSGDLATQSLDLEVGLEADTDAEAFVAAQDFILTAMRRVVARGLLAGVARTSEPVADEWNIRRQLAPA